MALTRCVGVSGMWGLATLALTCPPAFLLTQLQYKLFEKRLAISDERISLLQEAVQAISMIKMMAAEKFWFGRIKTVRDREFQKYTQARLLGFMSSLL
jgi:ABC-type bacteriocin/lantibiotic exporter with double-glycine peptidase domain